jgi:hypothetical protein
MIIYNISNLLGALIREMKKIIEICLLKWHELLR